MVFLVANSIGVTNVKGIIFGLASGITYALYVIISNNVVTKIGVETTSFFLNGMPIVGSTRASVLAMLESLFSIIMATFIFSEKMSFQQILGGILLLSGSILLTFYKDLRTIVASNNYIKVVYKNMLSKHTNISTTYKKSA